MKLRSDGTSIYSGDILMARCLTSASKDHEVTKADAEALAKKLVEAVGAEAESKPLKKSNPRKRAARK